MTVVAGEEEVVDFGLRRQVRLVLRVEAATERESYVVGETVAMTGTVTNISDQPVTLTFGGAEFDFAVFKDGVLVWRWTHGMVSPAVITTVTLQPGQCKTYAAEWDQEDFFDHPVRPGEYVLVGEVMALPAPNEPLPRPRRSSPYPFSIDGPSVVSG